MTVKYSSCVCPVRCVNRYDFVPGFYNTIDKFQLERPPEFQYKDWKVISPGEDHTLAIDDAGNIVTIVSAYLTVLITLVIIHLLTCLRGH